MAPYLSPSSPQVSPDLLIPSPVSTLSVPHSLSPIFLINLRAPPQHFYFKKLSYGILPRSPLHPRLLSSSDRQEFGNSLEGSLSPSVPFPLLSSCGCGFVSFPSSCHIYLALILIFVCLLSPSGLVPPWVYFS